MVKKDASYDEVVQAATSGDEDAQRLMTGVSESDERSSVARSASSTKPFVLLLLSAMGPGVVSAMAGNDAGGISTYSTAGAEFGYATLWVIPVMCVLLLVVQMTAARMGAVTGKGFAALIRERFGIRLAALAM
ncbi:MAG: divalent metal cation transporter, partial [Slackia sp.]|nr:divalent metal cation transporter [Slackia sp.]